MKITRFCILILLLAFCASGISAQKVQLSLSGNYGNVHDDYESKDFRALGVALGLELKVSRHFTLGGDLDWQRFESELAIASPYSQVLGLPSLAYSIDRHQINVRPTLRYYFKRAFKGLYVGAFGNYSYLTIGTSDYPQDPGYLPDLYTDPSDDFYYGAGLTYGFRLKLTGSLYASAYGSHQFSRNSTYKGRDQQDHQFGLGLNWVFNGKKSTGE
jgi:hypothetical protein